MQKLNCRELVNIEIFIYFIFYRDHESVEKFEKYKIRFMYIQLDHS